MSAPTSAPDDGAGLPGVPAWLLGLLLLLAAALAIIFLVAAQVVKTL
jgi:hypothetical protein